VKRAIAALAFAAASCKPAEPPAAGHDHTPVARAPSDAALPRPAPPPPGPRVSMVFGGAQHQCLVRDDGTAQCWGFGKDGALGNGATVDRNVPTTVPGLTGVLALALGERSTCALVRDGTVSCWGDNSVGQLGDGTHTARTTPRPVPGLADVVEISAGTMHVCALARTGAVRCWGGNDAGQLGDGTTSDRATPTEVAVPRGVVQLAVGGVHSCVRLASGTVSCWGSNATAELGIPGRAWRRSAPRVVPVPGLSEVVELAAGLNHTCARLASGAVACWGWDEECQLGFAARGRCISDTPCEARATPVPGLTDVTQLALGAQHTCALHKNGAIDCWGEDPAQYKPDNTDPRCEHRRGRADLGVLGRRLCAARRSHARVLGRELVRRARRRHERRARQAGARGAVSVGAAP